MLEIWGQDIINPFQGYQKFSSTLGMTLGGGPSNRWAYAYCPGTRFGPAIPVSDELARVVLGTRYDPCPFVGERPVHGGFFSNAKYRVSGDAVADEVKTFEICDICGFSTLYPGNQSFRAVNTGEYGVGVHPHRTYLAADRAHSTISDAIWNDGRLDLAPTDNDSTLIVWMKGKWHARKDGARIAAIEMFPFADVLAEERKYIILQDG